MQLSSEMNQMTKNNIKSIFTDSFPFIKSDKELQALIKKYPKYDNYYIASGSIKARRNKFNALYQQYYPYADRHFLSEIKRKFHQRTWEMYLGCVLLNTNIGFSSKNKGPDILIEYNGKKIWIECIACEKGDGIDRVPHMIYGKVQDIPENEMLLRIAAALKEKHYKYKKYVTEGTVKETDQFIVAVNTGALNFLDSYFPLILRCVFAIGYPTLSMPVGGGPTTSSFSKVSFIEKKNGTRIPMTFFLEKDYEGISAAFYCKNTVLNHSDVLGKDTILIYNPLAKNPLPNKLFDSFKSYKFDEKGNLYL